MALINTIRKLFNSRKVDTFLAEQLGAAFDAVINGGGYTIHFSAGSFGPADSTVYYVGDIATIGMVTLSTNFAVIVPRTGTITVAHILSYASSTAGSGESWELYIRLNDTTDTLIAAVASTATRRVFSNSALSIAVTAGDTLILKTTTPAWVTNPTGVVWAGHVLVT